MLHLKDKDPRTGKTTTNIPFDEQTSYREQISTYVHKEGSKFKKVELFWPHDLLKVSVIPKYFPGFPNRVQAMPQASSRCLLKKLTIIMATNQRIPVNLTNRICKNSTKS